MKKYSSWIDRNYPYDACKNACSRAVREIVSVFLELTVQVGTVNGIPHCWNRTEDGLIIDPTARQFTGKIEYHLIAERFLEPHEFEASTGAIMLDEDRDEANF